MGMRCTEQGYMEAGIKNHWYCSETVLDASLNTVWVCQARVETKPCGVCIGEECLKVESIEAIWILQCAEVEAESIGLE